MLGWDSGFASNAETFGPDGSRGEGCEIEDTNGAAFLDFSMGWGSVLVGHARPEVSEAVVRQAALGANFACVNENSLRRDEIRWRLRTG